MVARTPTMPASSVHHHDSLALVTVAAAKLLGAPWPSLHYRVMLS